MDRSRRSDRSRHVHGEESDVGTGVDRMIAGAEHAPDERDAIFFVTPADDVQADDVIGEIDEESGAAVERLDDQCPIVGVRVIAILQLKLGGGHQVMAQLRGIARSSQFRPDHVFVLRFAIEEQPVCPHDVFARESAGMLCVHVRLCARRDVGALDARPFQAPRESYH